jgi:hypothetical protein
MVKYNTKIPSVELMIKNHIKISRDMLSIFFESITYNIQIRILWIIIKNVQWYTSKGKYHIDSIINALIETFIYIDWSDCLYYWQTYP